MTRTISNSAEWKCYQKSKILSKAKPVLNVDTQMKCIVGRSKAKSGKGKIHLWLPCVLSIPPTGICGLETEHSHKGQQVSDPVAEVQIFITATLLLW